MRGVALVTGASRGIGAACASEFVRRGWGVTIVARGSERLESLAEALGARALPWAGDVSLPETNREAVRATLERFGRLDAAVANAGVTLAKTIDETLDAELDRVLAVNVKAIAFLAQAAHSPLARSRGALVVIASNKGLVAQRGSPAYVASKGAAIQLARALALDWAEEGIRVNAVCPGVVDTDMLRSFEGARASPEGTLARVAAEQPLGRLADPADCAAAVAFLASHEARYITGVALPVDGGFTAQ